MNRRSLGWLALVLAAASGCGGPVPLDTRASDATRAEALADAVAGNAGCAGTEAVTTGPGHWDFTCSRGSDNFLVQATTTRAVRDGLAATLTAAGTPMKTGPFYLVSPLPSCPDKDVRTCTTPPVTALAPFPGD